MDANELRTWAAQQAEACKADALRNAQTVSTGETEGDGLPPFYSGGYEDWELPPLPPVLIDGLLIVGDLAVLAGASKVGKTWNSLGLGLSVAMGRDWYGFACESSKVLYADFELDAAHGVRRVRALAEGMGAKPSEIPGNFVYWPLSGYEDGLQSLESQLTEGIERAGARLFVLDCAYMVMNGNENAVEDVRPFFRILSHMRRKTNCSILLVHHQKKGASGDTLAIDRASGSGVFARMPGLFMDVSALEAVNEERRRKNTKELQVTCIPRYFEERQFNAFLELPCHEVRRTWARLLRDEDGELEGRKVETSAQRGGRKGGETSADKREKRDAELAVTLESLWQLREDEAHGIPIAEVVAADGRGAASVKAAVDRIDGWHRVTVGGNACFVEPLETGGDAATGEPPQDPLPLGGGEVREG